MLRTSQPKSQSGNFERRAARSPPPPGLHGMVHCKVRAHLTLCPINSTEILANRIVWCQVDKKTTQWPNLSFLSSCYSEDVQLQISFLTVGFEDVYFTESMGLRCSGGGRGGYIFPQRKRMVFSGGSSCMAISREEVRKGKVYDLFLEVGLAREWFIGCVPDYTLDLPKRRQTNKCHWFLR